MDGVVPSIFMTALSQLLLSWYGVVAGVVVSAGLGLIALYFLSSHFRYAFNLFRGPSGRQAHYGYRKGEKGLQVTRSGYAFDEDQGRWRYVKGKQYKSPNSSSRYGRSYTRYQGGD